MALATQCPHCQTTFRVAHDQLKLRAGLVRCGACKEIFNGVEHLLRPGERSRPAPPPAPVPAAAPAVPRAPDITPPLPALPASTGHPSSAWHPTDADDFYPAFDLIDPPPASTPLPDPTDPLQRMTLMRLSQDDDDDDGNDHAPAPGAIGDDFVVPLKAASRAVPADQGPDEVAQAIEQLQRQPWRSKATVAADDDSAAYDAPPDEPTFVTRGRRKHLSRSHQAWFGVAAVLLLVVALGQTAYGLRDQIAARAPSTKPWLTRACTLLGCRIELLAQASMVSIESNELTAINSARNTFALTLLLRNSSELPQRWPALELTLLDGSDRPVSRRVFTAAEYLAATIEPDRGFPPNSEHSVRIPFELQQKKAANYRVYLFYP